MVKLRDTCPAIDGIAGDCGLSDRFLQYQGASPVIAKRLIFNSYFGGMHAKEYGFGASQVFQPILSKNNPGK
jgi:hypothetical protein